jgi:arylsulfatase A-like enzyme
MAEAGPARTGTAAAGAAAGVFTAAGLLAGEIMAGALAGAALPPRAWLLLALHYAPALALAGAAAALARPRRRPAGVQGLLTAAVAFAYLVAVVSQDVLRGPAAWARLPAAVAAAVLVAAGGWVVARARRRRPEADPRLVLALLTAVVVAGLGVASAALRGTLRASVAGAARRGPAVIEGKQPPAPPAGAAPRPNVLLIVLDTVRADSLSSYGYPRRTTPRLDAFAAGAVRHTQATTVSPWSVPAHASLFTGLLPARHGAGRGVRVDGTLVRPAPLDERFVTLAEALAAEGYATAAISANVLVAGHMNLTQGFRHVDVRRSPRSLPPAAAPLLVRGQGLGPRWLVADRVQEWFPSAFRSAGEIADAGIAWLSRPRPEGQPYFAFLNFMDAHTPFVAREGFRDRWPGRSARLPSFGLATAGAIASGARAITPEEAGHLRALYDAGLSYLDHEVGRLLAFVDALPDADRTLVIVTADHGEALGEHGRIGHDCVLLPSVMRVPLLVRHPRARRVAQPAVDARPIQIVDLMPLILEAAGAEPPDVPPRPRGAMVAEVDCFCAPEHPRVHGATSSAIVAEGLAYVAEEGRPPRLFELAAGPGTAPDLARTRAAEAARLAALLAQWRRAMPEVPPPRVDAAAAREREEALRAVGYVQ